MRHLKLCDKNLVFFLTFTFSFVSSHRDHNRTFFFYCTSPARRITSTSTARYRAVLYHAVYDRSSVPAIGQFIRLFETEHGGWRGKK